MNKLQRMALVLTCAWGMAALQPHGPVSAAGGSYTAKVYTQSLIVRSEPAKDAAVKSTLKSGMLVTVTDEQHGWMKVSSGKVSGWVAGYYLKKVGSGTASVVSASSQVSRVSTAKATVTASSLRIRSGPGTGYSVLGSLQAQDIVTPLLRQSGWVKIRTAGGDTGWVAEQYVRSGAAATTVTRTAARSSKVHTSSGLNGKLIVVDPGHGGSDPGMLGTTYTTMEKDLNLQTALYVRDYLQAMGARVEMTRTRDNQKPSLARRVQISHSSGADAFVSIHYNSSPKKVSGTLTFFYSEANDLKLARAVEQRLGAGIGLKSNGLSFGNYHILRENHTPSTLVELGFLSNPADESLVRKASYQRKAAKAIADGIADYF